MWHSPASYASAHWVSERMPFNGRVVFSRVHGHQPFLNETWVTTGATAEAIFGKAPQSRWTHASEWAPSPVLTLDSTTSLEAFKDEVRTLLREANATLLCRYLGQQTTPEGADLSMPFVVADSASCLNQTFTRGQWYTTIAFMQPTHEATFFGMHASWETALAFEPDNAEANAQAVDAFTHCFDWM